MPDYQPNVSIYQHTPSNPMASMSLLDLLNTAGAIRKFQTQQAISDSIRQATDPNTGVTNWAGAQATAAGKAPWISPSDLAGMSQAADAQQGMRTRQLVQASSLARQILNLGSNATIDDFNRIAPAIAALGIPRQMLAPIYNGPHSGPDFIKNITLLANGIAGPEATTEVPGQYGIPTAKPAGAVELQARGVGGGLPGIPSAAPNAAYNADLANSNDYTRQVLPLEKAIPALSRLGPEGTYPGADELNNLKTILKATGADQALGIDTSKVKDFTEAKKYFIDWANMNSAGGTNDRLAATFASNPNVTMNTAAAIDVAKTALSARRLKQAQVLAFQQTGLPQAAYPGWAASWNARQDVRAYGFDLMTPSAQKKLLGSLKGADLAKFKASLDEARESQVLRPGYNWNPGPSEE